MFVCVCVHVRESERVCERVNGVCASERCVCVCERVNGVCASERCARVQTPMPRVLTAAAALALRTRLELFETLRLRLLPAKVGGGE